MSPAQTIWSVTQVPGSACSTAAQIQTSVQREAATLALLYRGSVAYPEPLRSELQFLLRDYTLYVVHKDWPAHHQGRILQGGAARMGALVPTQKVVRCVPVQQNA